MPRAILNLFFILFFANSALAAGDFTLPEELEAYVSGYPQAPVIQCPRPKKKYEDMLAQLNGIKQKIKGEACPATKIAAIESEVQSLETLITDGRKNFLDLITKGTSGGGQLTQGEVETLQNYIDAVVKKTAVVTGLVNNPACFDEDEKVSTLSTLSSLISGVSGAIGALAGPFGAKISLGGKLAAGLLGSIDTIVQARKTYDYRGYEDRKNYLHNLCAYYQFKSDIDKETKVFDYVDRLYQVQDSADQLIGVMAENCQECQNVIIDFMSRVRRDTEVINTSESLGGLGLSASELSLNELRLIYFPNFSNTSDSPAITGHFDKASATLTALQAKAWAEDEIQKVQESDELGLTDEGRREVMRVQKQIEDFLVNREGARYVNYYRGVLSQDYYALERVAMSTLRGLRALKMVRDPSFDYGSKRTTIDQAFHEAFRRNVKYEAVKLGQTTQEIADQMRAKAQDDLKRALQTVRVDYSIVKQRCLFYANSHFDYTIAMQRSCDRAMHLVNQVGVQVKALRQTAFADRYGYFLDFLDKQNKNWVADWMASLTSVMQIQAQQF